jgi:WD repeat-containing protein 35
VIVGSVDGNRIWGRELGEEIQKASLKLVEWSPDGGRHLLFCTSNGDIFIYDNMGNMIVRFLSSIKK